MWILKVPYLIILKCSAVVGISHDTPGALLNNNQPCLISIFGIQVCFSSFITFYMCFMTAARALFSILIRKSCTQTFSADLSSV